MNILILGAGQVGTTAAYSLAREEANEVTIVDRNPEVLRELQDRLDVRTVVGDAAYPEVLERANAKDADMIIALTNSDESNMLACQIAHTLFSVPTKIARIRAGAYADRPELFEDDRIQLVHYPGALQVLEFADGMVRLVATRAERGGALIGHPLSELPRHIPNVDCRVVAIYRGGRGIRLASCAVGPVAAIDAAAGWWTHHCRLRLPAGIDVDADRDQLCGAVAVQRCSMVPGSGPAHGHRHL